MVYPMYVCVPTTGALLTIACPLDPDDAEVWSRMLQSWIEEPAARAVYEERIRGFLALRGQVVYIPDGGKPGYFGTLGDAADLKSVIKSGDWNDLEIVARGNTLIQLINGRVTSIVIDDDKAHRKLEGEIGIQLHKTQAAMKIETRNIRIKNFG